MLPRETTTTLTFTTHLSQNGNQYRAVFTNTEGRATTEVATVRTGEQVPIVFSTTEDRPIVACSLSRVGSMVDGKTLRGARGHAVPGVHLLAAYIYSLSNKEMKAAK